MVLFYYVNMRKGRVSKHGSAGCWGLSVLCQAARAGGHNMAVRGRVIGQSTGLEVGGSLSGS